MTKPLVIDLFCGLGGFTEGCLLEGYEAIGFDIEQHVYGDHRYPAQLVIQDVLTLHGSQFRNADLIVASPPCQAYSYRAMPWKRAKALPPPDNTLFESCFRIQREACEAAGHHIPLVVENVRGAQKWVGRARWNFGSFYLWGDVPALMPPVNRFGPGPGTKRPGRTMCFPAGSSNPDAVKGRTGKLHWQDGSKGVPHRTKGHWTNPAEHEGVKHHGSGAVWFDTGPASLSSKSPSRKFASAMIAKIPLALSRHIAATYRPKDQEAAA